MSQFEIEDPKDIQKMENLVDIENKTISDTTTIEQDQQKDFGVDSFSNTDQNQQFSTVADNPDGELEFDCGIQAWLQVLFSHLINFNSFGYMLSFGIFQGYYNEVLGFTPSNVSWIGTTELFLVYFVGVFSGRAMDSGYYRYTLAVGILLQLIGVFMTSLCKNYYQLFLAQGICQGLGNGLVFCPALALVSTYFPPRRRALAVSLVACGGATGGMVFPAMAQSLLPKLGFAWTVRCMGFVMLFTSAIVLPFSRSRIQPRLDKEWVDRSAFHDAPYLLFCAGIFLGFWGLYFAYYYVRPYAQEILSTSQSTSFSLILVINSFGIPGRIIPALLADRYSGPLNVIIPFIFLNGVLLYCWMAVKSTSSYFDWVAVYGFLAGGCQSLFQAASSTFTEDLKKVGVRIGMVCTIVSFACLSGPPISGNLIENRHGNYLDAQIFGGTVMVLGSLFLLSARIVQQMWGKKRR
jgi:predicted MFS family arabinose efflux permease